METFVYSIRTIPTGWRIVKFDNLLNVSAIYYITGNLWGTKYCSCWRKYGPNNTVHCKHKAMLLEFWRVRNIDNGWFYDYENSKWHPPVSDRYKEIRKRRER